MKFRIWCVVVSITSALVAANDRLHRVICRLHCCARRRRDAHWFVHRVHSLRPLAKRQLDRENFN